MTEIINFFRAFLKKYPSKYYDEAFFKLLVESFIIISPVMPHFANECWSQLKQNIPDIKNFDKVTVNFNIYDPLIP